MQLHRRDFLQASATAAAALSVSGPTAGSRFRSVESELSIISHHPQHYHGWPTVARRRNGQLIVVSSAGREAHVCPFGRVESMTSTDEGRTWTWPRVVLDGPLDDRDAGVVETAKGTLLVTSFSSLAYVPQLERAEARPKTWSPARLARWQAAHRRVTEAERKQALGVWMTRSTDGGLTWSGRYACEVNAPHGPFPLRDGRLLYAGKRLWTDRAVGVCVSTDDGLTWRWLASIPVRPGDRVEDYHELHGVETADGRLVVQIRNHNQANHRETLQTHSTDGGKSWSVPAAIGVWGLPSHLLRLRDGRLLMSYGHRRRPFGNLARLSADGGRTWSEPMTISGDGAGHDLGYPSTVELDDQSLLSVWYEKRPASRLAVLRQARWKLP